MATDDSSEKLILVMGETGVGKSTFVNDVTDSDMIVGDQIESCTTEVKESQLIEHHGVKLRLLDTPGYNDTYKTEAEILLQVATYLAKLHAKRRPIIGIIYLHNVNHDRLPKDALNNFDLFRSTVGMLAVKNVVVVTTQWDVVNASKEKQNHCHNQLQKLEYFGKLVKPEAILKYEGKQFGHILDAIVNNPEVILLIQNETVEQQKKLKDTAAGWIVNNDLNYELKGAKEELKKLKSKGKKDKDKGRGKDPEIQRLEERIQRLEIAQSAYKRKVEVEGEDHPHSQTQSRTQAFIGKAIDKLKRAQVKNKAPSSHGSTAGSTESL